MSLRTEIRIDIYTHSVKVSEYEGRGYRALVSFCENLTQIGFRKVRGRFIREKLRVFAAATVDRREFRFHRNSYNDLMTHLKGYGFQDQQIKIVERSLYNPEKIELEVRPEYIPRDKQVNTINYMAASGDTKVVTAQTGQGKGYMTMQALSYIGHRTVVVIKGMFLDKWVEELRDVYFLEMEDIMVVRGSAHLKKLIKLAKNGELNSKFIVITNKTMYNYIKEYERYKGGIRKRGYDCLPGDFYKLLKAGVRVIDELHMEFHGNFRQDLYTHVPKTISLTATLVSDDKFLTQMYELAYPKYCRFNDIAADKYISARSLHYRFNNPRKVRFLGKRGMYSHIEFENSIMKDKNMRENYLDMITDIAREKFVSGREDGQRMLIFAGMVDFCTIIQKHLQEQFKDLKVNRYVSEDEYDLLLNGDIMVTTIKSAGTAVDIPGLKVTLMTDALSSVQANLQAVGRLRRLKDWPDVTPYFYYLVSDDVPSHVQYHNKKVTDLKERVKDHKEVYTNYRI